MKKDARGLQRTMKDKPNPDKDPGKTPKNLPAPAGTIIATVDKKKETTVAAPPAPPQKVESKGDNSGGGRAPVKEGNPFLTVVAIAAVLILLIGLITIIGIKVLREGSSTPPPTVVGVPPYGETYVPQQTGPAIPPPPVMGEWEQVPPVSRASEPRGKEVPPVVQWVPNGAYIVPLRAMPDGRVAGYGSTYTNPPEGGGKLPDDPRIASAIKAKTANWTRNERGDWAILVGPRSL